MKNRKERFWCVFATSLAFIFLSLKSWRVERRRRCSMQISKRIASISRRHFLSSNGFPIKKANGQPSIYQFTPIHIRILIEIVDGWHSLSIRRLPAVTLFFNAFHCHFRLSIPYINICSYRAHLMVRAFCAIWSLVSSCVYKYHAMTSCTSTLNFRVYLHITYHK